MLLRHRPLVTSGDLKAFCWILDQWLLLESFHNMSLHPGIENNPVKCVATCFLVFRHQLFCFSRDFFQHPNQSPKSCTQTRSQDANFGWHVETVKTRMAFGAKTRTELHFEGKVTRLKKLQPLLTLLPSLKVHIQKSEISVSNTVELWSMILS